MTAGLGPVIQRGGTRAAALAEPVAGRADGVRGVAPQAPAGPGVAVPHEGGLIRGRLGGGAGLSLLQLLALLAG